jgi:anaerobic magnesium-protoporphyrin IX monomethyl ester cyclase
MGVVYPYVEAFFYPPHTLAVAAASLRDGGYQVQTFDGVVEEHAPDLSRQDVVGVFVSHASLDTDVTFISALRQQTPAKLIAFGPAMRFVGEQVLARAPVDAVLIGESEGFFVPALEHLAGEEFSSGPRKLGPETVGAAGYDEQALVQDLDALPMPAWDLLPWTAYPLLTVLSSRGCPDHCVYCPYAAAQGHRFRPRSVESVLGELEYVHAQFRPSRLIFRDPVFAHDRERVVRICHEMLRRGLSLRWECESRPEHFDAELLRLMKRAGCQWVKIGLETTDEALLVRMRRAASLAEARAYVQHVAEIVEACRTIGLRCRLFVMAGMPGQDVNMAEHTGRFVEELRPTALNVKLCEWYPGTSLPGSTHGNQEAQLEVLYEVQRRLQAAQPRPSLLARSKRWLRHILPGGGHV